MKSAVRLFAFVAVIRLLLAPAVADDKIIASGPPRAYKGPEGELVVVMEVNDGKEAVALFKNVGGELEGKALRCTLADLGNGNKDCYYDQKKGKKPLRFVLLTDREKHWEFTDPTRQGFHLRLQFSDKDTEKYKADDVTKALRPWPATFAQ
jgi:hypothetical protein